MIAQKLNFSGTVIFENDETPAIGAPILVTGSSFGTITDIDGNFSLMLEKGVYDEIQITYTNHRTICFKLHLNIPQEGHIFRLKKGKKKDRIDLLHKGGAESLISNIHASKTKDQLIRELLYFPDKDRSMPKFQFDKKLISKNKSRYFYWGIDYNTKNKILSQSQQCLFYNPYSQRYEEGLIDLKYANGQLGTELKKPSGFGAIFSISNSSRDLMIIGIFKNGKPSGSALIYTFLKSNGKEIPMKVDCSINENGEIDGFVTVTYFEPIIINGKQIAYTFGKMKQGKYYGEQYHFDSQRNPLYQFICNDEGKCYPNKKTEISDELISIGLISASIGSLISSFSKNNTINKSNFASPNGSVCDINIKDDGWNYGGESLFSGLRSDDYKTIWLELNGDFSSPVQFVSLRYNHYKRLIYLDADWFDYPNKGFESENEVYLYIKKVYADKYCN
jgi:hypothetical protein